MSPDGQRLLLSLPVSERNKSGREITYGLLFTSTLSGSSLRQLTTPSRSARDRNSSMGHYRATWSPNGKTIAFAASAGTLHDLAWLNPTAGCSPVVVVPSDGEQIPIDGWNDIDGHHIFVADRRSGERTMLKACSGPLSWLK